MAYSKTMSISSKHSHNISRSATSDSSHWGELKPPKYHTSFPAGHRRDNAQQHPGRLMPNRQESFHTRYVEMLLGLDSIPRLHNILATVFTWMLLAGFVTSPGTFTNIQDSISSASNIKDSEAATSILNRVKNVPLLVIAVICSGVGAAGMLWLWVRWRQNYVWLLNRLYLPGVMNSLAGLISTLTGVYAQNHGNWSITAKVTAIAEGASMVVCGLLFVLYNHLLDRVKRKHDRQFARTENLKGLEEGFVGRMERRANEPSWVI